MPKTIWIVTSEFNDYNQHGAYFIATFHEKPTFQQLKELLNVNDVTAGKLTRGGGRHHLQDVWFHLREMQDGELAKGALTDV